MAVVELLKVGFWSIGVRQLLTSSAKYQNQIQCRMVMDISNFDLGAVASSSQGASVFLEDESVCVNRMWRIRLLMLGFAQTN